MNTKAPMLPKGNVDLYNKVKKMHSDIYKKACWNRDKYARKVGFQLRGTFGNDVWTFKDLTDDQLNKILEVMENKVKKHPRLATKLVQTLA